MAAILHQICVIQKRRLFPQTRQPLPLTYVPPPPRRARRRRQHEERGATHLLRLQTIGDAATEELASRPLAGERDDPRLVAQYHRAQAVPVEMVIVELRIDTRHVLDEIGQAEAKSEDVSKLLRLQQPRRQSDRMERRPEHVTRPGIVRPAPHRHIAYRRAAEDDVEVGSEDVRKDGHRVTSSMLCQ